MKQLIPLLVLFAGAAHAATPAVTDVTLAQDPVTRAATITYKLTGADAIVTLDVRTNGVSIGAANVTRAVGDVARKITASDDAVRTITWFPDAAWGGHGLVNATAVVQAWSELDPPDYMVVDLVDGSIEYFATEAALPHGGPLATDLYRTSKMAFRRIHAQGQTFPMGTPTNELGREDYKEQEDLHNVTLTNDYYLGVFEVTQRQWEYVFGAPFFNADTYTNRLCYAGRPVNCVSWVDVRGTAAEADWPSMGHAVGETSLLGRLRSLTGKDRFDLPTDAEWEFACRAGTTTSLNSGENISGRDTCPRLAKLARYARNGGKDAGNNYYKARDVLDDCGTARVGQFLPNAWGLYDMHGNVWEWCLDWYVNHLGFANVVAPVGAPSGSDRIRKGGAHGSGAQACRSGYRGHYSPTTRERNSGVRVAFYLPPVE